jgi:hypothetical protein
MIRHLAYAFATVFKSRSRLVAENLYLRQQLIVFKRRQVRPPLRAMPIVASGSLPVAGSPSGAIV